MRQIDSKEITKEVKRLCIEANYYLPKDVFNTIEDAYLKEEFLIAKDTLKIIMDNSKIAEEEQVPICQDTGMACIFLEIGQDVHITGDLIEDAVNEGVRQGYEEGYLRKSVVSDPIERVNTKDNTPAVIYYEIVKGENVKITVAPKGFGSENMSKIKMLKPSDGLEGVKDFILNTVKEAGPNPCPPIIVGIGIGGTFDKAAVLSKKALLRPINLRNKNLFYRELEEEMLKKINDIGIGPQGFGGGTTALAVNIETFPTHIAGLPIAINISCHVTRHVTTVI